MSMIKRLSNALEDIPMEIDTEDGIITLALVNRLKARIARREARFKTRVVERAAYQADPPVLPAA